MSNFGRGPYKKETFGLNYFEFMPAVPKEDSV